MRITDKTKQGAAASSETGASQVSQDEALAGKVSAYLDGELGGRDLMDFETLLKNDEALSREIAEMRRIDRQLTEIGADILAEPIPDALLEALLQLEGR
ncbi:MAG: hypothetical protein WCD20_19155 [Rhodomicrobium sp.]